MSSALLDASMAGGWFDDDAGECVHAGTSRPFQMPAVRRRPAREAVVSRLLDWTEQARNTGRERRAEDLLVLAWNAHDRS